MVTVRSSAILAPQALAISTGSCIVTDRGVAGYWTVLGVSPLELRSKKVLDIGSGEGVFLSECSELGIDAVGIDPIYGVIFGKGHNYYADEDHLRCIARGLGHEERKGKPVMAIAAVNEALPFKDGAFDYVLGSHSSLAKAITNYPDLAQRELAVRRMLEEIVRVLKPGGEARVSRPGSCGMAELVDGALEEMASSHPGSIVWEVLPSHERCLGILVIRKPS